MCREYTGSMGLRINNTVQKIQQVFIDDKAHFAFNDHTVILPNLTQSTAKIKVILGPETAKTTHLSFVSKRMPVIEKTGETLSVKLITKNRAKFTFNTGPGPVLLNADGYEWGRNGSNSLKGYVTSDRTIQLQPLKKTGLMVTSANVLISRLEEKENEILLHLSGKEGDPGQIKLVSKDEIKSAMLNDQKIEMIKDVNKYVLNVNPKSGANKLVLSFE